jgi:hypothetical protein
MRAMSETQGRSLVQAGSRVARRPRTGAKVCLIISALFVVAGVYALVVPVNMPTDQGVFGCGSGLNPPTDRFAVGVCQDLSVIQQVRAAALGLAALVVAGLGLVLFGVTDVSRPVRTQELDEA